MDNNTTLRASAENKISPKEMSSIREKIHERIISNINFESDNNK